MRLVAQGLTRTSRAGRAPVDAVRRMVALQGQDLRAVLRAIAVRSAPGTTLADVRAAFDQGHLVRTWIMRGTLFTTTPADLAVLLAATGERMLRQELRLCADRGVDAAVIDAARPVLLGALAEGPQRRAAVLDAWERAGVGTDGGRGYHLLALFAYEGLVRFGPFAGEEQLLVGGALPTVDDPDAALAELLARWAAARGPVPLDDAAWWTGLPKSTVRRALAGATGVGGASASVGPVSVGGETMLAAEGAHPVAASGALLVPAFDEWLLGYRDRSLVASPAMLDAVVPGRNGVFRALALVDGRVVGTWRVPGAGARELELIEPVPATRAAQLGRALERWPH